LPVDAIPISTIVLGADIEASSPSAGLPDGAEGLLAKLKQRPAVLMVGTLEPRKGYGQALAAFEELWKQTNDTPLLVIAGRPGWKTEALQEKIRKHPLAGQNVFWLEDVSDELLTHLYAASIGVLFASEAEGFGLPLIEAALHGKPVLARDIPVFREIPVSSVNYFDDDSPVHMAAAISQWLLRISETDNSKNISELPTWKLAAFQLQKALNLPENLPRARSSKDSLLNLAGSPT
jgi:glycosyltransferase involved in cell wall biosynthesis